MINVKTVAKSLKSSFLRQKGIYSFWMRESDNSFVSKKRLTVIAAVSALVMGGIIFSYASIMLSPAKIPVQAEVAVERGSILDRNGRILAIQTTLYNIAVTKSSVSDKNLFAKALSPVTGIPEQQILASLNDRASDFFYLKKRITENEKNEALATIRESGLRGVRLEPIQSRTYPENNLASHIIGFVGAEGFGLTGAEYSFQETLSPPPSATYGTQSGLNVMLTIDGNIQYELENIARETKEETGAEAVMMIAVEAATGEILAYVSEPSANLNNFPQSTASERQDRPALYAYEPGSVFKIFSISALLDMGLVNRHDGFLCDGLYTYTLGGSEEVRIRCLEYHGWLTPGGIIRLSCNDGTAQIAERANNESFEAKLRDFGFGAKTGVELPGETQGIFRPNSEWSLRSKQTIAMGQEISVSALQMVEAATAIANQGKRLKLTLLKSIYSHDGEEIYRHDPVISGNPIKAETARQMLDFMQETAQSGTGFRASVGDVAIAVKTGTAQMLDPVSGGYSQTDFISSCMGIFPANNPEIILYLVIVKAQGETYGGRIAAPVISKATNSIIDYLGFERARATSVSHSGLVPVPAQNRMQLGDAMPNLLGMSKRTVMSLLFNAGLDVSIKGDGYVVDQYPPPGSPLRKGMKIDLTFGN